MENEVKEPVPKYNYISPEDYLAMERASEVKHEYYKGEVSAMSGASPQHNDIAYNINRLIAPFLHGKGCKLYGSDFRIHIPENELFTYPDFSIVCGKTETPEVYTDNLSNPTVIIEILSPTTKDYDRGTKFSLYRSIKTLKEYILIDSESIHIEFFARQTNNSWTLKEFTNPADTVFISTINLNITLRDIYEDVSLADNQTLFMENELKEPAPKYNYISPDEYLAMERESEEKHEYYDGFVIAMSGARLRHNRVARNLYTEIGNFLKGKECELLPSDMRVSTPNRDAYIYPDLTIVCGEPKMEDDKFDTLLNPSVIFEIWSPSTQKYDTGYKLLHYKNIPSLKEYIMVDTAKRFVQIVKKQADGAWRFEDIDNITGNLFIQTIGLNVFFDDLYAKTGL